MKIKEIINEGKNILNKNNFEDSSIISKELLCHTLNQNKQYLVIHMDEEIEDTYYKKFSNYIEQIVDGKPLQYITNKQEFMGMEFYVDENVLIPQPDTEILVENVLEICSQIKKEEIKILDLCTGSGAIAISINKILNENNIKNTVLASDISDKTINIAMINNKKNNANVKFEISDLFEEIKEKDFDIIVSNPPYIKNTIIPNLSKQVKCEPLLALSGGEDGLDFYRKIIDRAYLYIKNNGYLCLEIGYDQKKDVLNIFKEYENYKDIKVIKDLSNNDRCITTKVIL